MTYQHPEHAFQTATDATIGDTAPGLDLTGTDLATAATQPRAWTIDEVLAAAELPERTAHVCVKPSLLERRDEIDAELGRIIAPDGTVLEDLVDGEASLGDGTPDAQTRAQQLLDERRRLEVEIAAHDWPVTFRGKSSDDMAVFNKKHYPRRDAKGEVDLTEYNNLLMADTAISPTLTVDQVRALRKKLGARAIAELVGKCQEANVQGGVDPGKSRP